jgi:hypothetical protein
MAEPRVRFWGVATVVLLLIAIGYTVGAFHDWQIEADLINHGTLVQATINEAGGGIARRVIAEDAAWDVKFPLNGQTQVETGYPPYTDERRYNGDVIPIHVDPNNPEHWTNRPTPPPLGQRLIGLPFILGMAVICFLFAIIRAMRLRGICAAGIIGEARILSLGQSALAPRSYAVRCVWADERSRSIYSVFVSRRVRPAVDDIIHIAASQKSLLAMTVSDAIQRGHQTPE